MNIAILGYGYWGPNLVRNFLSLDVTLQYIVDTNPKRLELAKHQYPHINITNDIGLVLNDTSVDAIVIALPVRFHYEIAKKALLAGKNVLIEKPMTDSPVKSQQLIEIAEKTHKILMVDHTFLYTGAVQKICNLIITDKLGSLRYFDSVRINLGLFQSDVNVLWDLAPHDISILCYIFKEKPISLIATGVSHTENKIENIAYLTLYYQSDFIAHVNVSWVSPVKVRRLLIGGDKRMIVYDDIEPTEKVKVYDSSYVVTSYEEQNKLKVDYRTGDILIPKLDTTEALKNMAEDFCKAISDGSQPVSNYSIGSDVVKILSAAETSINSHGKEVKI